MNTNLTVLYLSFSLEGLEATLRHHLLVSLSLARPLGFTLEFTSGSRCRHSPLSRRPVVILVFPARWCVPIVVVVFATRWRVVIVAVVGEGELHGFCRCRLWRCDQTCK